MANICLGCLNPIPDADEVCRICGFSADTKNPDGALAIAAELQEHYVVGRLLCEGSDSLFYLGYDKTLKEPCFIQEYFPSTLCERTQDGQVAPLGGCENVYADYQKQFYALMRGLARAKDLPNIIPVYDIFEENGTCYAVSDYCAGETLTKKLERAGGRIPWQEARPLFMSLMTGIEQLAGTGIHHFAICPDNILISEDGKPHLRGFSIPAARRVGSDLKPRLATGYAAPEQYEFDQLIDEMTDVYGLAATVFRTVTGNEPPAGNNRAEDSDDLFMSAEIADELTQQVCVALFNALQVDPQERTAKVEKFHHQISMEPNVSALLDEDETPVVKTSKISRQTRTMLIVFSSVFGALLVVLAIVMLLLNGGGGDDTSEPPVSLPAYTTTTTTTKPAVKYSVPNLVDKNFYEVRNEKTNGDFVIVNEQQVHNEKPAGTILSQDPEPGTSVDKGATITVVISSGPDDKIVLRDVAGLSEEWARTYLQDLGFKVEIDKLINSTQPYGHVESTEPAAGTELKKGDTVTLRVSYVEPTEEESNEEEPGNIDDLPIEPSDDDSGGTAF